MRLEWVKQACALKSIEFLALVVFTNFHIVTIDMTYLLLSYRHINMAFFIIFVFDKVSKNFIVWILFAYPDPSFIYALRYLQNGNCISCLPLCGTVWFCRWLPMFRRNVSPPSSRLILKIEVLCYSELLIE